MSELCYGGDGGQVGEQGWGSPSWEDLEVREEAVPELELLRASQSRSCCNALDAAISPTCRSTT